MPVTAEVFDWRRQKWLRKQ